MNRCILNYGTIGFPSENDIKKLEALPEFTIVNIIGKSTILADASDVAIDEIKEMGWLVTRETVVLTDAKKETEICPDKKVNNESIF